MTTSTSVVWVALLMVRLAIPTSSDRGQIRFSKRTVLVLFTLLFLSLLAIGWLGRS